MLISFLFASQLFVKRKVITINI